MFRLTIRDALLLLLIVGLAIAWGIDRWRLGIAQDRLSTIVAELTSRDLEVEFDGDGLWISTGPDCSGGVRPAQSVPSTGAGVVQPSP
jgi:hypothetical protein